jgi:hypothetical protein
MDVKDHLLYGRTMRDSSTAVIAGVAKKPSDSDSSQKPNDYKIPQVSSKRKKQDAEYLKLRERFLTENPICQVSVAGCMNGSTDVHHTYAGSNRDAFYLVQSTWKAACRNCHDWIHTILRC